jgi:hypothetical protein
MGLGVIKDLWVWFSVVLGLCVKIFDSCYLFLVSSRIDVGPLDCDRCGKDRMLNEAHTKGRRREMTLRELLGRMRGLG